MSEYTPTTEEVRRYYIAWGAESGPDDAAGEFDRWLAAHDAELRREWIRQREGSEQAAELRGYQRGREDEQAKFAKWTNDAIDESERAKERQRGREEAAKAVEAVPSINIGIDDYNPAGVIAVPVVTHHQAVAAARGGGEQA